RERTLRVSAQAREELGTIRYEEAPGGLVFLLVLEDVHLLEEEPEVVRERGARRRGVPVERPQLRQHLADDTGDKTAVARDIFDIEQLQRRRSPRVDFHPLRHAIQGAKDGR